MCSSYLSCDQAETAAKCVKECCMRGAAGLFVLPESPRWLVVSGRLDEALAVIHKIYTSAGLQNGIHTIFHLPLRSLVPQLIPSAVKVLGQLWGMEIMEGNQHMVALCADEVEQELMELWSNVEKEKAAKQERTAARQAAGKPAATSKPAAGRGDEERLLLHAAGGGDPPRDGHPAAVLDEQGAHSPGTSHSGGANVASGGLESREGEAEQLGGAGPAGAGKPMDAEATGREQGVAEQVTAGASGGQADDSSAGAAATTSGATAAGGVQLLLLSQQLANTRLAWKEASCQ